MKRTKWFLTVSATTLLFAGTGLTSASADGGSYDTDGTVSFVVNPDEPSQQVVPNDDSGTTTGEVQNDGGSSSHSYVKPSDDIAVETGTHNHTANTTLPNTGVDRSEDWYLTMFGLAGLIGVGYVSYQSVRDKRNA